MAGLLVKYDVDGSGALEWNEFMCMVAENPEHFKLSFHSSMRAGLLAMARRGLEAVSAAELEAPVTTILRLMSPVCSACLCDFADEAIGRIFAIACCVCGGDGMR